jgi:P4 family phage/plasmid primase-like protien
LYQYISDNGERAAITSELLDLERAQLGYGIFFSVNGFSGGRRITENVKNINAFFVDIDYPDKLNRDPKQVTIYKNDFMQELFIGDTPEPTAIVETKNGLHIYWILQQSIEVNSLSEEQQKALLERYRDIQEALVKRFEGDPGAKDLCRVLRIPETIHQKDIDDPFVVKLIHYNKEMTYEFGEIRKAFLAQIPPDRWATVVTENAIDDEIKSKIQEVYPKLERPSFKSLLDRTAVVPQGTRNKSLLIIADACRESGWSLEQTLEHFGKDFYQLGLREIRRTIQSAFEHKYEFGYNNEVMIAIVPQEERVKLSEATSKALSKKGKQANKQADEKQKELYLTYEHVIAERYPYLKYKSRGDFYNYEDGVYKPISLQEVQSIILREMLNDGLTSYRRLSAVNDKLACFKSLDHKVFYQEDENANPNIMNLKNGLLDLSNYTMKDHTPEYLSTVQIPIDYNPKAGCGRFVRFVEEIMKGNQEQVRLLRQIAGYSLTTDTSFSKAFILYGFGSNGKSLFTRVLTQLVGEKNTSAVNLTNLNKQFGLAGIIGKRLNIIDEISGNYFESNIVKGIISGERMSADIKFRPDPIEFAPSVKMVFSVNELPKINDTSNGLYRRFIIIPFEQSFPIDYTLEGQLMSELTGILNWALVGLKDLREQGHFNETEKNINALKTFKMENSPVVEFIQMHYLPVENTEEYSKYKLVIGDVYITYKNFCFDSGYKPKALSNFARELAHSTMDDYKLVVSVEMGKKVILGMKNRFNQVGDRIMYQHNYE